MVLTENEKYSLIIPIILILVSQIYGWVLYHKHKDWNEIFTKSFVPILVSIWSIWSGLSHIILGKSITKSIGWNESNTGFQTEVGMFQLSIGVMSIYYLIKNNIKALVSITTIWILFIFQTILLHLKEILYDKNYNYNTIRPTITGTIIIIMLLYVINKVNLN